MKQRVKIISSLTLRGLEKQINDFLDNVYDLIDVKIVDNNRNDKVIAMVIYVEEEQYFIII